MFCRNEKPEISVIAVVELHVLRNNDAEVGTLGSDLSDAAVGARDMPNYVCFDFAFKPNEES